MANYKFDIFQILNRLSTQDTRFFDNLSDDDLKALHPLVLMRWLSGAPSDQQIYLLNEVANPLTFQLSQHKRLLLKLLMACTTGKPQRCTWLKQPSTAGTAKPITNRVVREYFGYSKRDATSSLSLLEEGDIMLMAEELGYQPDDITKLRKELKIPTTKQEKTKPPKGEGFTF